MAKKRYVLMEDNAGTTFSRPDEVAGVVSSEKLARKWVAQRSYFRAYFYVPPPDDAAIQRQLEAGPSEPAPSVTPDQTPVSQKPYYALEKPPQSALVPKPQGEPTGLDCQQEGCTGKLYFRTPSVAAVKPVTRTAICDKCGKAVPLVPRHD